MRLKCRCRRKSGRLVGVIAAVAMVILAVDPFAGAARAGSSVAEEEAPVVLGPQGGQPAVPSPRRTPADEETVTITGQRQPVEQGDRSIFTALPPRDLIARPLTLSLGLEPAITVVGGEQIEWQNSFTIVDALKYVPGGWTEQRGRKVKEFFSVRGQRYPYPQYLIDGAWFREFHETNFFLSAANVERLELLRSSSDILLSPGGMAGLINIVPKSYDRRQTEVETFYGSNTTWRTQVNTGENLGSFAYALGAGHYHTDGPHGENAEENMANLFGRLVVPANQDLTLSLTTFFLDGDRELQLAKPPANPVLQTRKDSYDPMRTYLVVGRAHYQADDTSASDLILNYGKRRFHGHRTGEEDWIEEDYEYGVRAVHTHRLSDANVARISGLYNHWVSPTGKRFYVGNRGDLHTYSFMVSDEHDFGRLTVDGGYRWSRTYVEDFGGFNVEGSPRGLRAVQVHREWEDPLSTVALGAAYQLTDTWSLHGHFTWGQISARPGLLNEDLKKPDDETRLKYDMGVKRAWDAFGELVLTAFFVDQNDAPLLSNRNVKVDGLPFALFESGDRESYGVELSARSMRFENGLQFFANAVAMQTKRTRDGDWGEDREVPDVILNGGASYLVGDWEFGVLSKHVSPYENERYLPAGADPTGLGGFTEVNAHVNYFFGGQRRHRAFFGVENITDREYSTVVGWPHEGRQFTGGVALSF